MADREKATRAIEGFARDMRDSYEKVLNHAVAMQERNVRFGQEMVKDSVSELRGMAEANQKLGAELVERVEGQRDAMRTVVGESVNAYRDLAFAPLSYYREGLAAAGRSTGR